MEIKKVSKKISAQCLVLNQLEYKARYVTLVDKASYNPICKDISVLNHINQFQFHVYISLWIQKGKFLQWLHCHFVATQMCMLHISFLLNWNLKSFYQWHHLCKLVLPTMQNFIKESLHYPCANRGYIMKLGLANAWLVWFIRVYPQGPRKGTLSN